ncbi:hypothetical protein HGA88_03520 [Candidatus Roizmanbacteria bacterium]|nr:hypothetical protein [Candidatus Roizmanbacteria bacterium]
MEQTQISIIADNRKKAQERYQTLKPTYCPALKDTIFFTSEGFNHLLYKNARRERLLQDQHMRYKLIPFVTELIALSHTVQDSDEATIQTEIKIKKRRVLQTKKVQYWGFLAIIQKYRFKVVVKKQGNGKIIFWSVIPKWKTNRFGNVTVRSLTSGDLEAE